LGHFGLGPFGLGHFGLGHLGFGHFGLSWKKPLKWKYKNDGFIK
jgi:hypothetical protein